MLLAKFPIQEVQMRMGDREGDGEREREIGSDSKQNKQFLNE